MKKILSYIILLSGILTVSCNEMLDLQSDGRLEMSDIFSHYAKTKSYFNSCYNYLLNGGFTYASDTSLSAFTDEAHDASDYSDGGVTKWYNDQASSFSYPLTSVWSYYYAGIRRCNTFLQYIDDPEYATYDCEEVEKNGWIARIKVLRAYYYLQLIKRYGAVPLVDTPYEIDYNTQYDYSDDYRASFNEVVTFIVEECQEALSTQASEGSSIGFNWARSSSRQEMSRATAYAIMSQAITYAVSPLWYDGTYEWEDAAKMTKYALDMCLVNGFKLYSTISSGSTEDYASDYANYFMTQSDVVRSWDLETIYDNTISRTNVWKWAGLPTTIGQEKAGVGPSQELIDAFELSDGTPILNLSAPYSDADHLQPNYNSDALDSSGVIYDENDPYANRDPRFYATIYYNESIRTTLPTYKEADAADYDSFRVYTYEGSDCGISSDVTTALYTRTGYYLRKFNNTKSNSTNNADGYLRVFRLAELYLNFAEAAYNAYGADVEVPSSIGAEGMTARQAVNYVRARVGMPALPTGLSKEAFERRYRNERRVEFAFEDHRFFDVRRWKILSETDNFVTAMHISYDEDSDAYTYTRKKLAERNTNTDKYLLYPLDSEEVVKMEKWTGDNWQNPGW